MSLDPMFDRKTTRMLRSGSWIVAAKLACSSNRSGNTSERRTPHISFRCTRQSKALEEK
mgnify:CR=1 FL=1